MSNVSKEIAIELVEDGQAGNGIVSVTRTYGISASGTTESDTTSPSDITTWSAGSPTVTTAKPYLWVKEITVYTETPDTTKYYCVGKRGDNGVDAKDFEWAYIRTTTPIAPTILNDSTYTDSNSKTYTADGHLPRVDSTNRTDIEKENSGSSSKYYECTDDPKGVNDTWKYEWEIKRTKGNVGADGSTRTWNYYVGEMTLHNNYAESAFIIDIDNDNDQFGTDSDSKVLVEQVRTTKVTLYDGAAPQTLTGLTATLKYEDGTNVPTSVAKKTTTVSTGVVSVTVKQNNTANTHTEIQAHIEATCEKGSRTIVFTLYKVMGGAPGLTPIIYNVAATDKVFSFQRTDANALTPSSRTSQINVARTEGNTTTILDQPQSGLTFSWGFDDESTAQASSQSIGDSIEITSTDATSHSSVWVELSTGDRETLAIVKDGAKGNSGTSVEAQYAPSSSPTSSQIHTTFQNGDKYMRTRSGNGSWSGWQKIVGENGAETDFTFNISKDKTSTSASTAPANCYYSAWQDAPIAVTTTYPYLWAKVVQKNGDGTIQSTRYIRLTGEDGKSVLAQYSVDGSSNWHTTFATGDEWMRTSDNGGTSWSAAMKIVGEDGDSTNFEFGISQYQTANGAPSDISTWSDVPIATTSSKPYLWSKVTTPDGTVSYIRLTGEKGASITKSGEVNTYKVSDSGTTTPTGTWYSTKAAANNAYAWSANRYMWTKTVITWSDTSTTTLYSAERNPEDGDAGMSIVIASQSVTYSKQTSGNLDPTTLTYGSYPSSLSKGDWLYSKTTVNYETSGGASAGSTNSYSVSYIGTDGVGQAGRGITGVYEHYKASSNSTGETTPTSTDWGTTPTPSDWGKNKPYLWNYERITYSSGTTVERTTASVVAVWTEDGAGIDSITNYYLATSASSGVTTSTSGWTASVQTMDETNCYLWNYERISYTQGKSSTTTTPHIIGHYGRDGEVITKVNETYRYATNNTGTRPDASSSSWQTEKPTLQKGYWLYTETTIHWSNNTETVLYTSERNPNDGAAGQSIIVDGSTMMKYYVGSSNTTHPAENSSDWKDLDQVTQTQGMWLWSKSTTYYRKANSTSGSHDAGSSVQYNVSYIAEDGDTPEAARGVESVTEYYKATNSSSPMSKPTSDSGWDTDPNLSNLTNKWGETYKYLWNYEKVTYNKAPLVERTIPQILAIWTKDGNAGKGIDSITNYYLINNSSTAPSRPSTDGTGGWSTTPTPPNSSNPYLWNYEKIVWLNPSSTTYTDVQMIGHYGKDGVSSLVVDLDNDSDQFGTDSNGLTLSAQNKATGVKLYYGTTLQTITKLVATVYRASAPSTSVGSATATTNGTEVSGNVTISSTKVATIKSLFSGTSGTITFGIVNNVTINDDFIIKIEAFRSSSESRTANFTLKQVKSGAAGVAPDLCNLRPTLAKVSFTKSELNGSTAKKLGCGYTLVTPSGTTNTATAASVSVNGTTYYIWWRYVGGTYAKFTTSSTIYSTGILPSTTQTGVEFVLSSASSSSSIAAANTLDYENVPIIKDGTDGKGITSANVWYALNQSSTTAPSDFTLDNFPSTLNAGYYVWEATKVTYTDGSSEFTGKMCLGATTEFLTGTEVYAASASNSTTPTSWSTTYTKTKGYYLWTATRVQYTNGTYAYLNPKCVGYWGKDGTSPYVADLDNEMDGVPCTYGGVTTASYDKYINVSLWHGSSPETLTKLTPSTAPTNVTLTPDITNKRIRVQVSSGKQLAVRSDITITVASENSGDKTLHFILNGVRGGIDGTPAKIYDIVPSLNEVSVGRGADNSYTPRYNTLQCGYKRSVGSDISTVIEATGNIDSTYRLFFRRHKRATASVAAAWETAYYYYNYSTYKRYLVVTSGYSTSGLDVATYDAVEFLIYKNTSNNSIAVDTVEDASNKDKIADKETVSVISDGVDGTSPIVVDLTNENDAMVYDEFGVLKSGNVTSEAKLYVGSQDKSADATWTITPTNCTLSSGNSRNIVVTGMSASAATVTATASYGGKSYAAILSLKKLINEDKYELDVTPVSIGYNSTTNTPDSQVISVSIWKVSHVDGSRTRSNPPSGYAVRLYKDGSDTSHAYSGSYSDWVNNPWTYTLSPLSSWSSCLVKLNNGTNNSTSAWLDYETIPIAKTANGANGTSPSIADLDNEMDSVACDKNGKVKASTTCGTNVSLFYGSSKRSYKITGITKNGSSTMGTGVTVKIDDSTPSYPTSASQTHTVSVTYATTATISSKDDFAITLQDATDTSITRVLHFTINGVREGANGEPAIIFRLNPNVSEIVKKKNGTYIPSGTSKVTCTVLKTTGSETSEEPIDETDDYVAKYKLNGTGSEIAFPIGGITVNTITSKLEIMLYDANDDVLLDRETIPLVEDGTDGTSPYLADLDNEMGGVVCDSDGYTTSEQYIETNAQLFRGTTAQTLKSSGGVVCSIAGYPLSSNYTSDPSPSSTYKAVISGLGTTSANIKVYAKANLLVENVDIKVTLTDTNDVSRDAILTMNGVRGGENGDPAVLFNLLPSVSAIKKSSDDVLAPTSLTCDVRKITGNSTPTRATSSDGTLRYRIDGDITSTSDGTALTINTGTVNSYNSTSKYITFAFFKGTTLVDKERVPIVYDGAKGDAGKGYKTIVYRDNFTEAQWATYGAIDHTETWDGTSSARNGCGVGDWFLVVGTATDSKDYHTATYECDNSSSNLHGKCINHQVTKNGETYRILYTWDSTTKIEVKDLPCKADYSGSFSGNFYFYLQRLVDGKWTDCPSYYWAIRGFNSSGGINYGYNGSSKQAANSISSSTVNNSTNRYFEVYFLTEAMTPAGSSKAEVTETTTRKIFMSSRISKVPAGDGGLSIATRPSTMVVNTDENGNTEAASQDFIFDVFKGDVEVTPSQTSHGSLPTGFTWTGRNQDAFTLSCPANTTLNAPAVVTFTVTISGGGSISDSIVLVPNKRGAKGADAIHLDLNNEMDSIQYAGNSTKVGSNVTTTATLYKGKEPIDSGVTYSIISYVGCSASSATINSSTGVATLSGIGANYNKASITIQAAYGSDNYTAVFVVNKIIDKPKYELEFDKNVISVNKSVSSASQENINVYVYKTTINSNGVSTRTLVSSLSSENLKLFHNDHGIIEVDSYNSGFQFSVLYTPNKSLTFYLTTSSASTSTVTSYILDMETIPVVVVENGAKGEVARQPYEWGKWSDFIANNSNTFVANKYEAPYFIKEEEVTSNGAKKIRESKWLWVGADGTFVPPSATPATGQSKSTTPSSSDSNWTLMVTNFKYLISEAQIADYGKFGSGVFSKDYAFSQYGLVDGGSSDHYKNFRAEFFKGQAYVMFEGSKTISTTSYPSGTPFEFGKIFLDVGLTYTFKLTSDSNISSSKAHLKLVDADTGASFRDWYASGSSTTYTITRSETMTSSNGNKEYAIQVYSTSGSFNVTKIEISVNKAFKPNLYIDWLNGEIYSQLGRFVNVTVEGVMNNLIQEVTSENYTNKLYRFDGTKAWLDVLSCGSVIRFASGFFTGNFSSGYDLYLPCACRASDIDTSATIQGVHSESLGHTNYTLDDVRQCVGKKLYIINEKKATSITFHCLAAGSSMLVLREHGWDTLDSLTEGSSYIYYNDHYSNVTRLYGGQYARNSSSGNGFFLLECKMGRFNDAECIYWEITASPWTLDNLSNS